MREISHLSPLAGLPAPMTKPLRDLPWMRRERADISIRAAVGELRALAVEDGVWMPQYVALADAFEAALRLIDAIEDADDGFSVRVDS